MSPTPVKNWDKDSRICLQEAKAHRIEFSG